MKWLSVALSFLLVSISGAARAEGGIWLELRRIRPGHVQFMTKAMTDREVHRLGSGTLADVELQRILRTRFRSFAFYKIPPLSLPNPSYVRAGALVLAAGSLAAGCALDLVSGQAGVVDIAMESGALYFVNEALNWARDERANRRRQRDRDTIEVALRATGYLNDRATEMPRGIFISPVFVKSLENAIDRLIAGGL